MDQELELRHLRYFVAVAEELHFGRAAQRLHLAQPPLSQQIRRLEEIVGHTLLARTSRAVRLTAAGEVFLERARRTLRNVGDDLAEARSVGRGEVGSLHVGFIGSCMLTRVPALLGAYRRQAPRVGLQLHESHTARVLEGLAGGRLDVGFVRDGGPTEGLAVERLFGEPYVAVVPAGHRLAGRWTIAAAALREEPFVFPPREAGTRAWEKPVAVCEAAGFRPRVVQEAPQWLTILRLVGAGLGVSIAPACVRQIAGPEVACPGLHGAGAAARSEIELAYRGGEERPIVLGFAAVARTEFGARRAGSG